MDILPNLALTAFSEAASTKAATGTDKRFTSMMDQMIADASRRQDEQRHANSLADQKQAASRIAERKAAQPAPRKQLAVLDNRTDQAAQTKQHKQPDTRQTAKANADVQAADAPPTRHSRDRKTVGQTENAEIRNEQDQAETELPQQNLTAENTPERLPQDGAPIDSGTAELAEPLPSIDMAEPETAAISDAAAPAADQSAATTPSADGSENQLVATGVAAGNGTTAVPLATGTSDNGDRATTSPVSTAPVQDSLSPESAGNSEMPPGKPATTQPVTDPAADPTANLMRDAGKAASDQASTSPNAPAEAAADNADLRAHPAGDGRDQPDDQSANSESLKRQSAGQDTAALNVRPNDLNTAPARNEPTDGSEIIPPPRGTAADGGAISDHRAEIADPKQTLPSGGDAGKQANPTATATLLTDEIADQPDAARMANPDLPQAAVSDLPDDALTPGSAVPTATAQAADDDDAPQPGLTDSRVSQTKGETQKADPGAPAKASAAAASVPATPVDDSPEPLQAAAEQTAGSALPKTDAAGDGALASALADENGPDGISRRDQFDRDQSRYQTGSTDSSRSASDSDDPGRNSRDGGGERGAEQAEVAAARAERTRAEQTRNQRTEQFQAELATGLPPTMDAASRSFADGGFLPPGFGTLDMGTGQLSGIDGLAGLNALRASRGSAAPPGVPQQLMANIRRNVSDGNDQFTINLRPAELGRVDIKLEFGSDGRVSAQVMVERAQTLELLMRDSRNLERTLQEAGLQTDANSLNFSLRDENGQAEARGDGDTGKGRSRRAGAGNADEAEVTGAEAYQLTLGPGRVDIHA